LETPKQSTESVFIDERKIAKVIDKFKKHWTDVAGLQGRNV